MCSIPGLPTPGSEVPVLITRVNLTPNCGLVELWVNMGDERKHIYEQMREEIQIPQRKFDGSEGKPADLCLVCIGDTWHRARIVSCQNETYNVFLIDRGQPHITTSEALAWGQIDSFLLPPEIESCILANVLSLENDWPETAVKFLKSLHGKNFQGLVQHVLPDRIILLDIPTVSKRMYKIGVAKKVQVDEFKCLVLERLHLPKGVTSEVHLKTQEQNLNIGGKLEKHHQYFYPELSTETFENVNVTEVNNPNVIFCKIHIFSKAMKILSEQIHQHYEESSDFGEAQPKTCGDPCAARCKNGRWHRSSLKQNMTSDGTVEVLHVDEGKTEFIPVGDIKPLHGKFLRMPVFTYRCSLEGAKDNGTGWTTEQTEFLKSLVLNQTFVARINHHNKPLDVYNVTLFAANSTCINNCFMEKAGLFTPFQTEEDLNVQNEPVPSSFLSFLGGEQCEDFSKVIINVDGLQEEALQRTRDLALNGREDGVDTSGADDVDIKMHLPTAFNFVVQNGHDDDVFTVGRSINVKVSCIESLQKFWCRATENSDSLRFLMQDLQNHYASIHPQPLVESICVARNPDNNMWYRARIMASHHSPVVDVRFIDYGQTRKVPLRDVRPIDPAFLRLNAQAFQCCLFNLKNTSNPMTVTGSDAALAEFEKFVDLGASSNTGLKCIVKTVTSDEEGLPLNVVDIETASNSACELLTQKCANAESQVPIPPEVQSDAYNYSTHNIEVGRKEKMFVTSSENVNHFYCHLERNCHLYDKVMKNVKQLIGKPQCKNLPLVLNSICFARYTDDQWYRGQVVEMSPRLKVHFVDHGDTLAVKESDVCPFPTEASTARSAPVQAVPLGLYGVPAEVPQEVNQWFADHAVGSGFTISIVAKEAKGKLIVEMFQGSLNVNEEVRKEISNMSQQKMTGLVQQTDQQLSKRTSVPIEDFLTEELKNLSGLQKVTDENSSNVKCDREELMSSQSITNVSATQVEHESISDEGGKPNLGIILETKESIFAETFVQGGAETTKHFLPSCPEGNVDIYMYKRPNISLNKTEEVYATCIVGPNYFWCQYTNAEDLDIVSSLGQEVGKAQQNTTFPRTLNPGSPCLALYSSDNQWYRAQVIQKTDSSLHVLFIDYGNESDVHIENVRPLPQSLLEKAPQAFLCSLNGFDESKGSWDDEVWEDFHNLLVDKPLKLTVFNMDKHSENAVPQYKVEIECEGVLVNTAMQKYWTTVPKEGLSIKSPQTETFLQDSQTESNMTHLSVSKGHLNTCMYKEPNVSKNKTEMVYASCIVEPHYFWCQYTNTEDLNKVSQLAQEAGQEQQDTMFSETLGPGSPCLALFSSDERWYRAQVICRNDDAFHVMFIDYGNESDIDIKNVRPLPQSLLDEAPQAFLCSLTGFDESNGSWDDEVYNEFNNLLVDKPLKLTVFSMDTHSENAVPQYKVEIELDGVVVNTLMEKFWKGLETNHTLGEALQSVNQDEEDC
uniref:tudor domain-containing 6-like n=1 Tax=Semicossyphus pulcher TaxID=241346 RepID=UPI0037E8FF29